MKKQPKTWRTVTRRLLNMDCVALSLPPKRCHEFKSCASCWTAWLKENKDKLK